MSWPNLDFYPSFPLLNILSIALRSPIQWTPYKMLHDCKICALLTSLSLKSTQSWKKHRTEIKPNVSIGLYIFICIKCSHNTTQIQSIHTSYKLSNYKLYTYYKIKAINIFLK